LIKLTKVGILSKFIQHIECHIPEQVYYETVKQGKKSFYGDAEEIEQAVGNKKIKVHKITIKTRPGFGKGEIATKHLAEKINAHAIMSDDAKFLKSVCNHTTLLSTHAIILLWIGKLITKKEAVEYIEKIKPMVTKKAYENAIKNLGGKIK